MEGDGIGPVASGCLHSVFMHPPGMKVVAPMTPVEYQDTWNDFCVNETPVFVSEHRSSYSISQEMPDIINQKSKTKIKQGKKSVKTGYKKAIITLKKGQSIDLTTGI